MKKFKGMLAVVATIAITGMLAVGASADEFELKRINPETLNKHPAYSQVTTITGDMKLVFVAGQVDRAVDYIPGSNICRNTDWHGQFVGMMDNVEKALEASGASWADVVYVRYFTVSMEGMLTMFRDPKNPVPYYWKQGESPPSTLVEVVRLSEPCQLIEADVMAAIKGN